MKILILNAGSSSLKCHYYDLTSYPQVLVKPCWQAKVSWQSTDSGQVVVEQAPSAKSTRHFHGESPNSVLSYLLNSLLKINGGLIDALGEIDVVGHRIVHGGNNFLKATFVDAQVKQEIEALEEIAPLHNQAALQIIEEVEKIFGQVKQAAVFDTAFHRHMPLAAKVYAGPYQWYESLGIRRFGFHGISHEYAFWQAGQLLGRAPRALITCHLGAGASLAAVVDGKSVDTTMGFTPLEGLMMASRSGSIDPGLLLYFLEKQGMTPEELGQILNSESGLKGIAGKSSDMQKILESRLRGDSRATLAFDMYIHSLQKHIGSMLMSTGIPDAIVLTGGVGENCPEVRKEALKALAFLNLELDDEKNLSIKEDGNIAAKDSSLPVFVISAREDFIIARQCFALVEKGKA